MKAGSTLQSPQGGRPLCPQPFLNSFTAAAKREKINARSSRVMKNQRYESEMSVGILRLVGPLSQCTQHTCWKVRCWSFRKCPPPLPLCKRCGHDSREITAMKMQIQYFASHPMSVFAAATDAELFLPAFPFDFSHVPFLTGSASSRIVPEELRGERSDLSRPRHVVSSVSQTEAGSRTKRAIHMGIDGSWVQSQVPGTLVSARTGHVAGPPL